MAGALRLSPAHHARQCMALMVAGSFGGEGHGGGGAGLNFFLPALRRKLRMGHRTHRQSRFSPAGVHALVADGAVVGHAGEPVKAFEADAAPGLFFVQEGLSTAPRPESCCAGCTAGLARGTWVEHTGLHFAAAQAVFDRGRKSRPGQIAPESAFRAQQFKAGVQALRRSAPGSSWLPG